MVTVHIINPLNETTKIRKFYFTHTARSVLLSEGYLPVSHSDNEFQNYLTGQLAFIILRR